MKEKTDQQIGHNSKNINDEAKAAGFDVKTMSKKTKLIQILARENIITSIIRDTYSFVILGFFFWFNYHFIGGSYVVNFLVLLCCYVYILKFGKKTSYKISDQKFKQIQLILLEDEKNK